MLTFFVFILKSFGIFLTLCHILLMSEVLGKYKQKENLLVTN